MVARRGGDLAVEERIFGLAVRARDDQCRPLGLPHEHASALDRERNDIVPAETPVSPPASLPDQPAVGFGVCREGTNIEPDRMQDSVPPPTVSATAPEPVPPRRQAHHLLLAGQTRAPVRIRIGEGISAARAASARSRLKSIGVAHSCNSHSLGSKAIRNDPVTRIWNDLSRYSGQMRRNEDRSLNAVSPPTTRPCLGAPT